MNVKRCDRCGKVYEREGYDLTLYNLEEDVKGALEVEYDLCSECSMEFRIFMKSKSSAIPKEDYVD